MDTSIRSTVFRTIDVAWRRRFLLVIPLLIMLPMSVVVGAFLGGGYTARSLVMMQQTVASNPLSHDNPTPDIDTVAQMLKSLRALLASDFVLAPVVEELSGQQLSPAERAARIKALAQNVNLDLLGNDILEFRFSGSSPKGLGLELQKIMASFIKALVDPPGQNAGDFLLNGLRNELSGADRDYAALNQHLATMFPNGLGSAEAQLASWRQERDQLTKNLTLVKASETNSQAKRPGPGKPSESGTVLASNTPNGVGVQSASTLTTEAKKSTQDRIADLNRQIDGLASQVTGYEITQAKLDELAKSRTTLRERYEAEKQRLGGESAVNWRSIINAPERMIVIDPPKDPELRTTSRLKFVLSGVLGGILLGVLLTILAEIFDTTIRHADQMSLAGVVFLGQLPPLTRTAASFFPASAGRKLAGSSPRLQGQTTGHSG